MTRFQPGDEVFGQSLVANLWRNGGAFAEYAAVPAARFEPKPAGLTFEQAAAVPTSGSLAVQVVRDEGRVGAGQTVLINGAGGAVGTFAVQLAKAYGARRDRRGCRREARHDPVDRRGPRPRLREGGLHPERRALRRDPRHRQQPPWSDVRRALTPEGTFVLVGHDQYGGSGPSVVREPGSLREADGDLTLRAPAASLPRREGPRRPARRHEGADRGRQGHAGDRPDVPAERGPRRDALPGVGASPRGRSSSPSDRDPRDRVPARLPGFGRSR